MRGRCTYIDIGVYIYIYVYWSLWEIIGWPIVYRIKNASRSMGFSLCCFLFLELETERLVESLTQFGWNQLQHLLLKRGTAVGFHLLMWHGSMMDDTKTDYRALSRYFEASEGGFFRKSNTYVDRNIIKFHIKFIFLAFWNAKLMIRYGDIGYFVFPLSLSQLFSTSQQWSIKNNSVS